VQDTFLPSWMADRATSGVHRFSLPLRILYNKAREPAFHGRYEAIDAQIDAEFEGILTRRALEKECMDLMSEVEKKTQSSSWGMAHDCLEGLTPYAYGVYAEGSRRNAIRDICMALGLTQPTSGSPLRARTSCGLPYLQRTLLFNLCVIKSLPAHRRLTKEAPMCWFKTYTALLKSSIGCRPHQPDRYRFIFIQSGGEKLTIGKSRGIFHVVGNTAARIQAPVRGGVELSVWTGPFGIWPPGWPGPLMGPLVVAILTRNWETSMSSRISSACQNSVHRFAPVADSEGADSVRRTIFESSLRAKVNLNPKKFP